MRSKTSVFLKRTLLGSAIIGGGACIRYKDGLEDCTDLEVSIYRCLSMRTASRIWGSIASLSLPGPINAAVCKTYSKIYGVNLEEAQLGNIGDYKSLADLFTRALKDGARIIDHKQLLISPADGAVMAANTSCGDDLPQIKGVTYSLRRFLEDNTLEQSNKTEYCQSLLHNPKKNVLHQVIIYLAPGDYHRFHSPCSWTAKTRKHFSGKLLSVSPSVASVISDLFCINERVVYTGEWKHGFFSYTAVGATNVGSITIFRDEDLQTNKRKPCECEQRDNLNWKLETGELFGQFNMGSTIVLIFEAPPNFKFSCGQGSTVKMGIPLGSLAAK